MTVRSPAEGRVFRWYLESLVEGGRQLRRTTVYPFPFRFGRLPGLSLTLSSDDGFGSSISEARTAPS